MGEERGGPQRFDLEASVPVAGMPAVPGAGPTVGMEFDNVHHSRTPSSLVAGPNEAGVRTEWDAGSLDSAIAWLETHAEYLNRLANRMPDIQDLMGGPNAAVASGDPGGPKSPLGTFDWAVRLSQKHAGLYTSAETAVKTLSENLYDAAAALRKVKENYENAEGANAMTAADMQRVFADVSGAPQA